MKFKYIGPDGQKSMELIIFGIMSKDEELKQNTVYEVPDDNKTLITGLNEHGWFEIVHEPKKPSKTKKGEK